MKVLIDTNVVLDLLLDRRPFAQAAAKIVGLAERSEIAGFMCATTVTTIHYLLTQSLSQAEARVALRRLLEILEIAPVNRAVIEAALRSKISDFEDAVLERSAQVAGLDAIVTRNTKDFRRATIKAMDPLELLSSLRQA